MGGKRLVRRLTSKELTKRIIKEKTENIALQCVNCRAMYEIKSKFSDGCICSSCGSPCKAIGFLSSAKLHKSHTQHEAAEQESFIPLGIISIWDISRVAAYASYSKRWKQK